MDVYRKYFPNKKESMKRMCRLPFGNVVSKQGHWHGSQIKKVEKGYKRLKKKKIDTGAGCPEKLWMLHA